MQRYEELFDPTTVDDEGDDKHVDKDPWESLNKSPIIVLGCGHFFTMQTLDGIMDMRKVYVEDQVSEK